MNWPDDYLIPGVEPYHIEEAGIIYCADCRDILPHLPKVDLVLTDPPFSERTHVGARSLRGPLGDIKNVVAPINFESFTEFQFIEIFKELIGKSNRWVIAFCDYKHAAKAEERGLPVVRIGIWVKLNPMPQLTGDRPGQGYETILILHPPGKKEWNGKGKSGVWHNGTSRWGNFGASLHPAEKPLKLIKNLLQDFSHPDELILDPFLGSGTTAVAAKELGRKFIGIEISEEYCKIAVKRLRQGVLDFG